MEIRIKVIEDREYKLALPPARMAMMLCTKVSLLVGPSITSLGLGALGKTNMAEKANDVLSQGASALSAGWGRFADALSAIDPEKLDGLIMSAVRMGKLHCNGKPVSADIDFERHFGQHRGDIYPVAIWAIIEQVRDFFPQLGNWTQAAEKIWARASQSPKGGASTTGAESQSGPDFAHGGI